MRVVEPRASLTQRVFISYSHDSAEHKQRVLELANRLREDGVDAQIDQYEISPSEGWAAWTEAQIEKSDFVLIICSELYAAKFQRRASEWQGKGVKWEGALLTLELYQAEENAKFIPVAFSGSDRCHIPRLLSDSTSYDLSNANDYDRLYRHITGQPLISKPGLGRRRNLAHQKFPEIGDTADEFNDKTNADDALAQLDDAYHRRAQLNEEGVDVTRVQKEIVELRRRLRNGGQLRVNDYLLDGRLRLLDRAGHGGFATVWKAYDRKHRDFIAVKILHGQYAHDQSRLERFFRGSRRMAELHHPGIVRVVDEQLEEGGFYFFTMEYLSGGDLRKAVLGGRLPPARALEIIIEVGAALQFAHERGLIHRDVKPANILIGSDGHARLTDFDLVHAMDSTGGTRTGPLGTVVYAAPEVIERSHEATVLADVYGLGMTAVFALSGADLTLNIFREAEVFIDSLDTANSVNVALKKAVAWKAEERFPSVDSFCNALQSAINATPYAGTAPAFLGDRDASPEAWAKSRQELLEAFDQPSTELGAPEIEASADQQLESMEGRRVGAYRLVRQIGAGGMAVVYLAESADEIYRMQVAVKLMRIGAHKRFRTERRILASLSHPNIAHIFDGGITEDGIAYLVMEFVEGIPIDKYYEQSTASLRDRLELFRRVCSAVQFAHQHLVIHRDLKPANILVTPAGVVKLLDFGIAKMFDATATTGALTRTGIPLTPLYASPEQVRGEALTTGTDIYSLGVILYKLLTGKLPYASESEHLGAYALALQIIEKAPPLPSDVVTNNFRRQLMGDLDTITAMALRKEPARRYASVQQFSDDIERHLLGLPVIARRDTVGYRLKKFIGRHLIAVILSIAAIVLILAYLVLLGVIISQRLGK